MRTYFTISIVFICFFTCTAQEFLQLEVVNDPESIKFPIGSKITIKTKELNEWHTIKINKLLYQDTVIVYEEGFIHLSDIVELRLNRTMVNVIARSAQTFGTTSLVYGALSGSFVENKKLDFGQLSVGLSSIAFGWTFRKLFYHRKVKMGSRYRLRLMDLRIY